MFVGEVADRLGVTATTILRLIHTKRLPAVQACASAPWILNREDVNRFSVERKQATPPSPENSTQLALEI